jgi:ABC-type Fe3+ transport system substrate-binding protein
MSGVLRLAAVVAAVVVLAAAIFTNASGTTFRAGVINASIAPITGSAHAEDATAVLDYLFSPDGQSLPRPSGFLPTRLLVGGDRTAVPEELKHYVKGAYPAG